MQACPNRILSASLALLVFGQAGAASAQEEDVQLWVYATAEGETGGGTPWALDGSLRFREEARGDEQQTLRLTITPTVSDAVALGGGFGVFEAEGGQTELRPFQQMNISLGRFSARTRVEGRFFDGADRMELRLRQRVRYTQPIGNDWSASVDGEFLHLAQRRERNSNSARNQIRVRGLITRDLGDGVSIGGAYMMIYTPRPVGADRINHVPQIYLTKRF